MRKYILALSLSLFATSFLQAAQVTENAARTIATRFMQQRGLGTIAPSVPMKAPRQGDASPQASVAYYVFNAQPGHGYVVVSGDDRTQQVLGYSDKGYFNPNNVPPVVQEWLDQYVDEIDMLDKGLIEAAPEVNIPTKASSIVRPLTQSQWGQDAPFYFQCPKIDSEYCVTGCTATAMAQIMYYHQWPSTTSKVIPAYTTKTNSISMTQLPVTSFSWNSMKDYYSSDETSTSTPANSAVAKLMLCCGQAVQMDYGTDASSGPDCGEVFVDYFRYSTKARKLYRCDYSYSQWENYILAELKARRPVMYVGFKHKGGHAYVCDGYDGYGYYHFNWGWYGSYDGYFRLSALYPQGGGTGSIQGNNGYNMSQRVIIGLEPNTISTSEKNSVTECYGVSVEKTTYTRSSSSDPFVVTLTAWHYNNSLVSRTYDLGWGVYDSDGYTRKQYYQTLDNNQLFEAGAYTGMTKTINFGKGFANGTYYLRPNGRETGNATWLPCHYSGRNYIKAVISGNTLTLTTTKTGNVNEVTASIKSYSSIKKVNRPLEVTLNVTNQSFNGDIPFYLWANNKLVGANTLMLTQGKSGTVGISFTPTASGAHSIKVTADSKGENVYCTGAVTVSDSNTPGDLTITYSVTGANSYNQVNGNKLTFNGRLKNNLTTAYNDYVILKLYKQKGTSNSYGYLTQVMKAVTLTGSSTATHYFDFDRLEPAKYLAVFYYYSYDDQVRSIKTSVYEVLGGINGDVNGDGKVNVSDVTALVNMILGVIPKDESRADINGDGNVNVSDVTALVNIILSIT
ncbi:MAG: C10 family peptidase [Muribaculaceae bacterium]|nr:C10 family peptidase [Muribaculaceae bacterium]